MKRRRRAERSRGSAGAPRGERREAAPPPRSATERLQVVAVVVALLGTAWLVDPWADAAFDAPKRLCALLATAVGGAALVWEARRPRWREWSPAARIVALAALAALGGLGLAATASPYPNAASSLRAVLLYGMFALLGASPLLNDSRGRRVLAAAAAAASVNALLSLAEAAGMRSAIPIARVGGRFGTGALLGNEGYVALACALLGAASIATALGARRGPVRLVAAGLGALAIATIGVNQQLTSAAALAAGAGAAIVSRWRPSRAWLAGAGALVVTVALAIGLAPQRDRTLAGNRGANVETLQAVTTFRFGAWATAAEMVFDRPLLGHGPGSFALAAPSYRERAELRLRARLLPPPPANAFIAVHQEYLQVAAEAGVVTLAAVLVALCALGSGLSRVVRASPSAEPRVLLALLVTGAVASLAWFPMQIPFTAVVLLLAGGRAWRLVADARRPV